MKKGMFGKWEETPCKTEKNIGGKASKLMRKSR